MAIKKKPKQMFIDLTGPQGNAFYLLGVARRFANQLGLDANKITEKMESGDYENLIETFDKYFGHFITLYR